MEFGISFWAFGSVFRAAAPAAVNSSRVQLAADDVIPHARQIFHASAADHDHGVLLQIVPHARNIRGHFLAVGKPDTGDFPQGRVRLLRRGRGDLDADAALERAAFGQIHRPVFDKIKSHQHGGRFGLGLQRPASFAN